MRMELKTRLAIVVALLCAAGVVAAITQAQPAAQRLPAKAVTIRVALAWSWVVWRGTFVGTSSNGQVVDRGTAEDHHGANGVQIDGYDKGRNGSSDSYSD